MAERRRPLPSGDIVVATALLVAAEVELVLAGRTAGPFWAGALLIVALTVPLAWRRQAPLVMVGVLAVATVASSPNPIEVLNLTTPIVGLVIAAYSVAVNEPRRRAMGGLVISFAGNELAVLVGHAGGSAAIFIGVASAASWGVGRAIRARQAQVARLQTQIDLLGDEGQDRSRLALVSERSRVATRVREVVYDNVDAMLEHSHAARRLFTVDEAGAEGELSAIEIRGQRVLADLRDLLGVLRSPDSASMTPFAGLGQVPDLVDRARETGRVIELRLHGDPRAVPASADRATFRILQDVLDTGPNRMAISIHLNDADIRIEATGRSEAPPAWPTVVMRERVASCGGMLSVPGPQGQLLAISLPIGFEWIRP